MLKMISGLLAGLLSFVTTKKSPKICPASAYVNPLSTVETRMTVVGSLTRDSLHAALAEIEKHDLPVDKIYMNPREFCDINKHSFGGDHLAEAVVSSELPVFIWGVETIVLNDIVAPSTVRVCTEKGLYPRRVVTITVDR